jgi:hypothetical protein
MTALNATISVYRTATPTLIPTLTFTPQPLYVALDAQAFSVRGTGQLRECPNRACAVLAALPADIIIVSDQLIYGEDVDMGNNIWYRTLYGGYVGYVYSAAVVPVMPTLPLVSAPPTSAPISAGAPNPNVTCPNINATCSQLTCEQAYACLAAGNRRLDGDGNGIPCQSVCGGG